MNPTTVYKKQIRNKTKSVLSNSIFTFLTTRGILRRLSVASPQQFRDDNLQEQFGSSVREYEPNSR